MDMARFVPVGRVEEETGTAPREERSARVQFSALAMLVGVPDAAFQPRRLGTCFRTAFRHLYTATRSSRNVETVTRRRAFGFHPGCPSRVHRPR